MCFDKIAFGMGDWVLWFPTNDTPAMDDALDVCRPMPFPLHVQACAVCFTRSRAPKKHYVSCKIASWEWYYCYVICFTRSRALKKRPVPCKKRVVDRFFYNNTVVTII